MKFVIAVLGLGLCLTVGCLTYIQKASAQTQETLSSAATDPAAALPPGATFQDGVVSHPITSEKENLHLLAAYYYGNPRQWKKIYRENRAIIRNPNRLPVGQTLRISVGNAWTPVFSYAEWFNLATRNGEWVRGQWQRAVRSLMPAPAAVTDRSVPAPQITPAAETTPQPAATEAQPEPASTTQETPPVEQTATPEQTPTADVKTPAAKDEPDVKEETSPAQETPTPNAAPPTKDTPKEKSEEQKPAFDD